MKTTPSKLAVIAALALAAPLHASITVIDWSGETPGQAINPGLYPDFTVSLSASGSDYLSVYDTTGSGGEDPDLEQPWTTGNAGNINVGNALIIQDANDSDPNDSARGGTITFDFTPAINNGYDITGFGFYWADMDENSEDNTVTLSDNAMPMNMVSFQFSDLINGLYPGASSIDEGEGSLNVLPDDGLATLADLGLAGPSFKTVQFELSGSGAIPQIQYEKNRRRVPDSSVALWPVLLGLFVLKSQLRRKWSA